MEEHINDFSVYWDFFVDTVLLVFSLFFCYKPFNPKYLRIFPWFAISIIADGIAWDFVTAHSNNRNLLFYLVQYAHIVIYPFDFIFFSYLLLQKSIPQSPKKSFQILITIFFIPYLIFCTLLIIHSHEPIIDLVYFSTDLFKEISLVVISLFYFKKILKFTILDDITKQPMFWIASAVLFKYSIEIPITLFENFFMLKNMPNSVMRIYAFESFLSTIAYLFFIKAMTCRIKQPY